MNTETPAIDDMPIAKAAPEDYGWFPEAFRSACRHRQDDFALRLTEAAASLAGGKLLQFDDALQQVLKAFLQLRSCREVAAAAADLEPSHTAPPRFLQPSPASQD